MYDHKKLQGLIFHHFHNEIDLIGQGSIDSKTFESIINSVGEKYNLLSANNFYNRFCFR